jgi:hypothetical protein
MKRFMAFAIALLFLMVAASALYAAETTFKGEYQVRAWTEWNFDKKSGYGPPDYEPRHDGWFDQRFRLFITHERSEFLKAVIRFDIVDDTWGEQRNFRINNSTTGEYIDQAYIEFKLPKIGTFTLGKQPVIFGNGLMLSQTGPGLDGVKWSNKWGPVSASALYLKIIEEAWIAGPTTVQYNWDANLWALDLNITPNDKHNIELYGGVLISDYGWPMLMTSYNSRTVWGVVPGAVDDFVSYNAGFVGLAYTGNFADMIDVKAEYGRVFGRMNTNDIWPPTIGGVALKDDIALEGWQAYLDVAYYNDLLRVGLAFFMSSGQKNFWGNATSVNLINTPTIISQNFQWGTIIGSNVFPGINHLARGPWTSSDRFALENVTSVKLYFEVYPMEKLSLNAAVIWAKWTDPVGTNPLMNPTERPAYGHPALAYYSASGIARSWEASDNLGWEIDFGLSYEIMEGLTYSLAAGVLLTGDSWDYVNWDGTHEEWGPIWEINNTLMYKF